MLLCAGVLLASLLLGVNERNQTYLPLLASSPLPEICPFKRLSGYPCAGCGLTRSTISITHGEWQRAWQFHRVGFAVYLFIVALLLQSGANWWRERRGQTPFASRWIEYSAFVTLALLLGNWAWNLWHLGNGS